jgi:YVTN family beta-propeller protein
MRKTVILLCALTLGGCADMNSDQPELNITYPAAYVVNGGSSTISVINLTTNTVTDVIKLRDGSGTQMQGMNMGMNMGMPMGMNMGMPMNMPMG